MAGQVQLNTANQDYYYDKSSEMMLKQADLYYIKEHFAVNSNFDKYKFIHSQLMTEVLCDDDCEIVNFIYKKLTGQLVEKKKKKKASPSQCLEDDSANITINNYYNLSNEWENPVSW